MKKPKQTRTPSEIRDALARLRPLEGEPIVDAVIAALRWAAAEGEWRELWDELEARHSGPRNADGAPGPEPTVEP